MATLRTRPLKDGTTTHTVLFRHNGRQTSETFDTDKAAAAFMRDIDRYGADTARRILDSRRPTKAHHVRTVSDQLRAHVAALSGVTLGTRRKYERLANVLAGTALGALPLDAVNREDVARWIRDLEASGLSSKTIRDRQALLSAAFVRAVDDELMIRNPARGARIGRTERREPTFLTVDEFTAILNQAPLEWHPFLITLAGTGLRMGEITALQVGDVELNTVPPTIRVARGWVFTAGAGRIVGAPKTANGRRTIGIGSDVVEHLRPLVAGRKPDAWLFHRDGEPINAARVQPLWRKWVKASGIGKTPRCHDVRHAHASWMLARNYPLSDLSRRLGHASIKVTADTYAHLTHDAQSRAALLAEMGLAPLPLLGSGL